MKIPEVCNSYPGIFFSFKFFDIEKNSQFSQRKKEDNFFEVQTTKIKKLPKLSQFSCQ
jgi:hypothetical protein